MLGLPQGRRVSGLFIILLLLLIINNVFASCNNFGETDIPSRYFLSICFWMNLQDKWMWISFIFLNKEQRLYMYMYMYM